MKWYILDAAWLIILLYFLLYFGNQRRKLLKAKHWQKTTGQIMSLELQAHRYLLWPKVTYLFAVGENSYQNDAIFLQDFSQNLASPFARKLAYGLTKAYQENQEIEVFYNPENPKESALNLTIPNKLNAFLVLIIVLLLIHGGMFVFHLSHLHAG